MEKIKILTPDNIEVEYTLASLTVRAAAAGVDMFIQGLAFGLCILIGAFFIDYGDIWSESSGTIYLVLGIIFVVYGLIYYGYYVILDIVMKGQTIGKKVFHIRIIRENGEGINIGHAMIREFVKVVIDVYCVGVVMVFFTKKHKRLGDVLASTIVVEENKTALQYSQFLGSENKYNLKKEEIQLLKESLSRKNMDPYQYSILQEDLVKYFKRRLEITDLKMRKRDFLESLLK